MGSKGHELATQDRDPQMPIATQNYSSANWVQSPNSKQRHWSPRKPTPHKENVVNEHERSKRQLQLICLFQQRFFLLGINQPM